MGKAKIKTFDQVVEYFGGIPALAKLLGIKRQAIYMWKEEIPEGRAWQIQVLSKGAIKAEDICQDCVAA